MRTSHKTLDLIASLFTAVDVDWDEEIADDGYTDFWGRTPLNEPLWISDFEESETAPAPLCAQPHVAFTSKKHA